MKMEEDASYRLYVATQPEQPGLGLDWKLVATFEDADAALIDAYQRGEADGNVYSVWDRDDYCWLEEDAALIESFEEWRESNTHEVEKGDR